MNDAKLLRTQLDLSQDQLALLLNVPKSTLSMYELGKRSLPNYALDKLLQMQQLHLAGTNNSGAAKAMPAAPIDKKKQGKMVKALQAKARKAEISARPLAKALAIMQENFYRNQNLLQIIHTMQAEAPAKTVQKAGLDLLESKIVLQMGRFAIATQAPLLYRLRLLQYQQQAAAEIIAGYFTSDM